MLSGEHYHTAYLFFVTLFTFIILRNYNNALSFSRQINRNELEGFLVMLAVAIFIGFRPIDIAFVDMVMYAEKYAVFFNSTFTFNWNVDNLIWDNFFLFMASCGVPIAAFFFIVAFGYFGLAYWACKRFFPKDSIISFFVFLAAFSTFSYGTNGIKAGLAASIFLLAISYRQNLKVCIPLTMLTYAFHHSMAIPIVAFGVTLFYNKPKYFIYLWLLCIVMAIGHVTFFQVIFANFTDEHGAEYLIGESAFKTGFRLDFIVYSAMPICIGWKAMRMAKNHSVMYRTIFNIYVISNSTWMLCMYASFTNRIAYLSWFLYPVVLIYPILNEQWNTNRYSFFSKVVKLHLSFTLFMTIIYYGILR